MASVIKTKNLSKSFGKVQALKDVSLEVEKGQIFGFLGPNGAGKSTFIKTLVGGVKPTSGEVEVLSMNPLKNKRKLSHRIGYMPQDASLYNDLSVNENIRFFAKLHMKQNPDKAIDEILDFLGMSGKRNERVQNLSGGMKTRISLACAMIHQPDILFLDEPTAGLDPSLKRSLWEMFKKLAGEGRTLFISTHLMEEALLCDTLAIIDNGHLLVKDTPDKIISKGKVTVEIKLKGQSKITKSLPSDPEAIARLLQGYDLSKDVESLDVRHESLEDVIIKIVDGEGV